LRVLASEEALYRFIELANERGGRDNITAVLVEVR
jgi:serine/threonine protein phosphatase PrpC